MNREMNEAELEHAEEKCSVFLRVLGTDGRYPDYSVRSENHLLVCDGSIAWSAVREAIPADLATESEINWLWPEEIRLYAAVSLVESDPSQRGRFLIHPWTVAAEVEIDAPFASPAFVIAAMKHAHELAEQARSENRRRYYIPQRACEPETCNLGDEQAVIELINAIDVRDELIIRGLSRLLAANHLISYAVFFEESAVTAYIALEAALECLRQDLENTTDSSASIKDVFQWIRETFPTGESFADVLEADYDNRITMVHPSSRFGEYWAPPVHADEAYELIDSLVHLYRYILLGEVWDPFGQLSDSEGSENFSS